MNLLALDFEYRKTHLAKFDLVACSLTDGHSVRALWLHNDVTAQQKLKQFLLKHRDTHTLLAFNVDAEGRSLISLGLNPIKFKWIDLQAEWKMLTNHNDKLGYGKQFIDGIFKTTTRKQYGVEDGMPHDKAPVNLLGCTYKLLGKGSKEDYDHKEAMRDLIINTVGGFNASQREKILEYCKGDILDLHDIYEAQMRHYKTLLNRKELEELPAQQLYRGETVARAALISSIGYPVDPVKIMNFTNNIPHIIKECQEDINSLFPGTFNWNKKEDRYSVNTKKVKEWIEGSKYKSKWPRTPTKDFSLSLDAFEEFFSWRHEYPRDNFFAQFLRWLRLNQSLNGFRPKGANAKNKSTFFSYYDGERAHPYLNAYGAQSARYQPKATGFIHLKAAWMRSLVEPKPGRAICGIDYSSEEFILAALMSKDANMIKAYESGDVYLYFAKLAGAVPWDGTKKEYKKERDKFKSTTLGISYQMGAESLANKLTADTGEPHTIEDGYEMINLFANAYPDYHEWIEDNEHYYCETDKLKLPDGWYMFGDNDNRRSVGNMPIQGMGSCILRKAIQLAQDAGLTVILPLHDALYIEFDSDDLSAVDKLEACMREAFAFYFKGETKAIAWSRIRLDADIWSPDYSEGEFKTPGGIIGKKSKIYVDERSGNDFERFSKYFGVTNGQ